MAAQVPVLALLDDLTSERVASLLQHAAFG